MEIVGAGHCARSVSGYDELLTFARKMARERLTRKQKSIIRLLRGESLLTTSQFARHASERLACSRSAIFSNLNSLRRCGIVESRLYGTLHLTGTGRLVSDFLEEGGDRNDRV